jgi:hypothetical protein
MTGERHRKRQCEWVVRSKRLYLKTNDYAYFVSAGKDHEIFLVTYIPSLWI